MVRALVVAVALTAGCAQPFADAPKPGPVQQAGTVLQQFLQNEMRFFYTYSGSQIWLQGYVEGYGIYRELQDRPIPKSWAPVMSLQSVKEVVKRSESYPYYIIGPTEGAGAVVCFFPPSYLRKVVKVSHKEWVNVVGRFTGATKNADGAPLVFMHDCRRETPDVALAKETTAWPDKKDGPLGASDFEFAEKDAAHPTTDAPAADAQPTGDSKPPSTDEPTPSDESWEDDDLPMPALPGCDSDADCKGDRTCVDRVCTGRPPPFPVLCTKDTECREDLICFEGKCTPPW